MHRELQIPQNAITCGRLTVSRDTNVKTPNIRSISCASIISWCSSAIHCIHGLCFQTISTFLSLSSSNGADTTSDAQPRLARLECVPRGWCEIPPKAHLRQSAPSTSRHLAKTHQGHRTVRSLALTCCSNRALVPPPRTQTSNNDFVPGKTIHTCPHLSLHLPAHWLNPSSCAPANLPTCRN